MDFLLCLAAAIVAIVVVGLLDLVLGVIVMKFGEVVGLVVLVLMVAVVLYFDVRRGY